MGHVEVNEMEEGKTNFPRKGPQTGRTGSPKSRRRRIVIRSWGTASCRGGTARGKKPSKNRKKQKREEKRKKEGEKRFEAPQGLGVKKGPSISPIKEAWERGGDKEGRGDSQE